ncbi:MAG: molybdopterin-dependent oxidoreductase [Geobacteraceae bacterium]|nr:molybdopterin-dependent oxidoreductase [Geobacteraceae bacterium]
MKFESKPGMFSGALAGAMLTLAMIGVFFAGWRLAGWPFVPFELFDWLARVLPGRIISLGINSMVSFISALNLGPTADVAKTIEQTMGIALVFFAGTACGAILLPLLKQFGCRFALFFGISTGAVFGILTSVIISYLGHGTGSSEWIGILWIILVFIFWGVALGWSCNKLLADEGGAEMERGTHHAPNFVKKINRRQFLVRLAGASATITVSGAIIGALSLQERRRSAMPRRLPRWSDSHALPNANARIKPAPGTRPELTPLEKHYRIDIDTVPPVIDQREWKLQVNGLVDKPLAFTLEELRRYPPLSQFITLACISNPVGGDLTSTTRWTGVSLGRLLPELRLKQDATHLKIRGADGFWELVSLDAIRSDERVMLAYDWDGVPLLPAHGFPLRIYIPDLYGMKQPKWIESIEAVDQWEPGYWVVRGWDRDARMKATSVIDTVAVNSAATNAAGQTVVPIGGIAHAGARGISKVELKVDDGQWQQAELRTPLSQLTWVIWRFDFPFQQGEHTLTVRCYDSSGKHQIETESPPDPSGATGLFRKQSSLM